MYCDSSTVVISNIIISRRGFKYLVSLCEYPEQKADDSRVKHGVSIETKPGKIHADLYPKIVADIICKIGKSINS